MTASSHSESGAGASDDEEIRPVLTEITAATLARDPEALTPALTQLVRWVLRPSGRSNDDVHERWLRVMPVFHALDLSIWEERPTQVEELALVLTDVDYYRQTDLSLDERLALLVRARKLLAPKHYRGISKIDLARAELESMRGNPGDLEEALALCDDALACVEQLDDEHRRGDALLSRAMVLLRMGRHRDATQEAERAREIFERENVPGSVASACRLLAHVNIACERMANAVPLLREALAHYEQVQDSPGAAFALVLRAVTWKARGNVPKALQDCEDAVKRYDRARLRTAQGRALLHRAGYLSNLARYMEAQYDLELSARYLAESPEVEVLLDALLSLVNVLTRRRLQEEAEGRLDEAEAAIERVARPASRIGFFLRIAGLSRELPTPGRERIRRCGGAALSLARELRDEAGEKAAKEYLAFAG